MHQKNKHANQIYINLKLKISPKIRKFKPKKGNANTYLILWVKLSLNDLRMMKNALEGEKIEIGDVFEMFCKRLLCFSLAML
jgi:hypothetical protein